MRICYSSRISDHDRRGKEKDDFVFSVSRDGVPGISDAERAPFRQIYRGTDQRYRVQGREQEWDCRSRKRSSKRIGGHVSVVSHWSSDQVFHYSADGSEEQTNADE